MKRTLAIALLWMFLSINCFSQNFPWNNPLKMAWSADGVTFNAPTIFQDSSGVPSVIRWKGDTLIAAFQWFRAPNPSPSWDRVAVKFSFNNGLNWTQPTPIVVSGLPAGYQRPFDPTLALIGGDSIRIYYSSSATMPVGGLDSNVNTYSAKSADGINYFFEPNPRVDVGSNRVIDPAVIFFNNAWHYISPIGAPQQGAYHYISPDGVSFSVTPDIPSDNMHNWTGNYMVESNMELRFYGSGQTVWYNSTQNGGVWNGYVATNVHGGDPSVVKIANNSYLMVFVGGPYTGIESYNASSDAIKVIPNPARDIMTLQTSQKEIGKTYVVSDAMGRITKSGKISGERTMVDISRLAVGVYCVSLKGIGKGLLVVKAN